MFSPTLWLYLEGAQFVNDPNAFRMNSSPGSISALALCGPYVNVDKDILLKEFLREYIYIYMCIYLQIYIWGAPNLEMCQEHSELRPIGSCLGLTHSRHSTLIISYRKPGVPRSPEEIEQDKSYWMAMTDKAVPRTQVNRYLYLHLKPSSNGSGIKPLARHLPLAMLFGSMENSILRK